MKRNWIGGGIATAFPFRRPLLQDGEPGADATSATATAPAAGGDASQAAGGAPQATTQAAGTLSEEQFNQVTGPLLERVRQTVEEQVRPVQEENQRLNERLDQLSQPQRQAGFLMGGAPGIRRGEDTMSSRGWSMQRVIGLRTGYFQEEDCTVEREISQKLWDFYVERGGFNYESRNSILVPLGTQMLTGLDREVTEEIQQSMAASVAGFDRDALAHHLQTAYPQAYRQALSQFDDSGLGVFLGPTQRGEMIELIRAREVFSRSGATNLTLPPNGRLQFDKHTGAVTAYWVGEVPSDKSSPTITASEPTSGYLTLLAKKLGVLVKAPNELLRFSTPDIEAFFRADMARVAALEADQSMLQAVGSNNRVKGLIQYSGIQSHTAGTVAANGNTFEPEDVADMKVLLEEADHDPESGNAAFVMRPKMFGNLRNRRAAAHTAGTYDGPWLFPMNRDDIGKGTPPRLDGDPVIKSTQVSNTREKGSSTDLSYILYGLFNHWIIGRVGVAEFATTDKGDTSFQTDQTWFRFIQHIDAGPRYENAFVMCDDIDMDLPA